MTIAVTHSTAADSSFSATGVAAWEANHVLTGVGTMAEQDANNVNITGGSISGVTVAGVVTSVSGTSPIASSGGTTPAISIPKADASTNGYLSSTDWSTFNSKGSGTVTSVSGTAPIASSGGATPAISISQAGAASDGYLSSTDWNTFNNKQPAGSYLTAVTADSPLSGAGTSASHLVIAQAGASTSGYLSSTDWNTFNNKQPAGTYVTSVGATSPVTSSGGTTPTIAIPQATSSVSGYLTNTDWSTFNNKANSGANSDITSMSGITGAISSPDYIQFDTAYATTLGAGQLGWNGNDTLGLGMIGGNVIQHIGEDTFFYVKASSAITKGQLCMFTGAVGSSGVLTAAPATAIPFAEAIIGVAAEDIANNGFGLIQNTGTLKGVDTSAFLDGDILYYNSAVTGGFTKTFPTSGPIVIVAAVTKAGSGGSGVLTIRVSFQTRVTAGTGVSVTQGNDVVTVANTGVTSVSGTGTVSGITLSGTVTSTGNLTLGGTLEVAGGSF